MRVTENSVRNTVESTLQNSRQRMDALQRQASTLKRINKPSDDPVGNLKLMRIRDEMLNNEQYSKNASMASTFLNYTDTSMMELLEIVNRAKELTIQMASSAANGPESRAMVAEEIGTMRQQLLAMSNRRIGDRYLFSGFKTRTQPFDDQGAYFGDAGEMMVEVGKDIFVSMNVSGEEVFLGRSASNKSPTDLATVTQDGIPVKQGFVGDGDIFRTIDTLYLALMTNDSEQIQGLLEPLDEIQKRVIGLRAMVSSRVGGINSAGEGMAIRNVYNAEIQSRVEDADLIKVVSDIAKEETTLKASLAASQKLIQPSLLDFLR